MPSKSSADAASPSAAALGVRKSLADAASPSAAALGVRVRELEKFKMRRSSSVPANSTNSVFKRVASQLPPSLNFRGELLDADAVARVASSAEREKTPAALDLRSASFLSDEAVCQLAAVLARGLLARVDLRRCSGLTADARATLERAADKGGARRRVVRGRGRTGAAGRQGAVAGDAAVAVGGRRGGRSGAAQAGAAGRGPHRSAGHRAPRRCRRGGGAGAAHQAEGADAGAAAVAGAHAEHGEHAQPARAAGVGARRRRLRGAPPRGCRNHGVAG